MWQPGWTPSSPRPRRLRPPRTTELGAGLEALESLAAELASVSDLATVNERLRLPRVDTQLAGSDNDAVAFDAGVVPLRSVEP